MKSEIDLSEIEESGPLPRYFTVSEGLVVGDTGRKDAEEFAGDVGFIQEYLVLIADQLGSPTFTHGAVSGPKITSGFVVTPGGSASQPNATGMMISERIGFREFLNDLQA